MYTQTYKSHRSNDEDVRKIDSYLSKKFQSQCHRAICECLVSSKIRKDRVKKKNRKKSKKILEVDSMSRNGRNRINSNIYSSACQFAFKHTYTYLIENLSLSKFARVCRSQKL